MVGLVRFERTTFCMSHRYSATELQAIQLLSQDSNPDEDVNSISRYLYVRQE